MLLCGIHSGKECFTRLTFIGFLFHFQFSQHDSLVGPEELIDLPFVFSILDYVPYFLNQRFDAKSIKDALRIPGGNRVLEFVSRRAFGFSFDREETFVTRDADRTGSLRIG